MSAVPAPGFLTPRDSPTLAPYHEMLDQLAAQPDQKVTFTVEPDVVADGEVTMFQEIVVAAQHHPLMLKRLLFGLHFKFTDPATGEPYVGHDWKYSRPIRHWFNKLVRTLPFGVYFLADADARFYALTTDLLEADDTRPTVADATRPGGRDRISVPAAVGQRIDHRALEASEYLLFFCRAPQLDPRPAIDALLEEFDVPAHTGWGYEQLVERVDAELAKGFQWRAGPASATG